MQNHIDTLRDDGRLQIEAYDESLAIIEKEFASNIAKIEAAHPCLMYQMIIISHWISHMISV